MKFSARTASVAVVSSAALVVSACGGSGTSGVQGGAAETTTLTVTTTIGGPDDYHNIAIASYMDAVKEASEGRIDYEFTYANGIVPPAEVGAAVGQGTVDLSLVVTSYNPSEFPISNWLSQAAFTGVAGPPAMNLERSAAGLDWWWSHDEAMRTDFLDQGLMPLTPAVNAINSYHLLCTSPVTSLADARGKSVRTPGQTWAATAEALGMIPVSLPGAEMYESLQRGIVDCVMTPEPDVLSSQLNEVAQHYTTLNLAGFTPYGIFMNNDTWESLPQDLQRIMWDEMTVYIATLMERGVGLTEELLETENMNFYTADQDLLDAIEDHHEEVLSEMVDTAPGTLADPQSDLESYQMVHEKWNDIVVDELGVESATTWAEWHDGGGALGDIDFEAYADRVMSEILAPHRP